MKSVIPFTKELEFTTKVKEITSISLEREFEVKDGSVEGNLFVTGDYKSHEISVNIIPFSFKIPFTIEIPLELDQDSIRIEISDFAYDMIGEDKIKVNIELELEGEEKVIPKEDEEPEESETVVEVDADEIIKDLEERQEEEAKEEEKEVPEEEPNTVEESLENTEEKEVSDENREEVKAETLKESETMILTNVTGTEDEYTTYHIHMVKEGETVETICTMYNSNASILGDYNDLNNVVPGEKLIIPSINE